MTQPTRDPDPRPVRALAAAGAGYGAALLLRPGPVIAAVCPELPRERRWVARLLGARLVAQHALLLARPVRGPVLAAAAVDALHAASMVPLLPRGPYRRAALVSGAAALGFAVVAAGLARPAAPWERAGAGERPRAGSDRRAPAARSRA